MGEGFGSIFLMMKNIQRIRVLENQEGCFVKKDSLVRIGYAEDCSLYDRSNGNDLLQIREGGELAGSAFYLNSEKYNWELGMDDHNRMVLVPIRKE